MKLNDMKLIFFFCNGIVSGLDDAYQAKCSKNYTLQKNSAWCKREDQYKKVSYIRDVPGIY